MTNRETYINTPFLRKLNHILMVYFTIIQGSLVSISHQMGRKWHNDRYYRLDKDRKIDSSKIFSSFKIWEFRSTTKFVWISENEEEELPQIPSCRFGEGELFIFNKIKEKIQKFHYSKSCWSGISSKYQTFWLLIGFKPQWDRKLYS